MAGVERGEEESEFSLALEKSLESFVHKTLKDEQRECIRRIVVEKKDVLALLPTGFGKSVIYQMIPSVLRNMRAGSECNTKTTVVVVSPLEYIRKQQVAVLEKLNCGISAAAIGDSTEITMKSKKEGSTLCMGVPNSGSVIDGGDVYNLALFTKQRFWLSMKSIP